MAQQDHADLTRNEANPSRCPSLNVSPPSTSLSISRRAKDTTNPTYPVTSTLTLRSDEERTFIDIAGEERGPPRANPYRLLDDDEDRVWVGGLPVGETFTLEIRAPASHGAAARACTATDPEDGEVYLYTQFEPNDAHRAWPCVDQLG